jgi:hypothetical protein
MATLAIEINDAGLTVADGDRVIAVEPGYALLDGGRIVTGEPAFGQARLQPRRVSNRYWNQLSLSPGSAGLEGSANAAELAYAQLQALWQRLRARADDVVLTVPGYYDTEQLGLLLGLAEECGMPVRAMVDAAAAASLRPYPGRQLLYVDAGLHRVSVIALEQGDEVTAGRERGLEAVGLAAFNDLLAKRLAEIFVWSTRFDPFHEAASEQQLYDLLPACLERLQTEPRTEATLTFGGETFTVDVEREQLLGVTAGFYRALLQLIAGARESEASLVVQLSDRVARLPDVHEELARLDDAQVVSYSAGHAPRALLKAIDRLPETADQVKLLRHFVWRDAPAEHAPARAAPPPRARRGDDGPRPTHVVYRGIARRVDGDGIVIGRAAADGRRAIVVEERSDGVSRSHCELVLRDGEMKLRDLSRHGTFVNEKRVAGEYALRAGDVVRIGSPGVELQIVALESQDGA